MTQQRYLIDSDALIVAKNQHYSPVFCPAFWDWIIAGNAASVFYTIDKVADELMRGSEEDFLRGFIENHADSLILKTKDDLGCLARYAELQSWASDVWTTGKKPASTGKALEVFAAEKSADPWLVVYASVYGFKIISNESSAPESQSRVMLPDAANAFGVEVVKLHDVLNLHSGPNFLFK